jgi:hypothetical protein
MNRLVRNAWTVPTLARDPERGSSRPVTDLPRGVGLIGTHDSPPTPAIDAPTIHRTRPRTDARQSQRRQTGLLV